MEMQDATTNNEGVLMCDICPEQRAVAMYQWSWGEKGYCSLDGQQRLNQQAKNLKQSVSYLPIVQAAPEPLRRDERTRLIAEKLAAESECADVLERNSRLYAQNTDVMQQLRALKLRNAEADRQISDLTAERDSLNAALAEEVKRVHRLTNELAESTTVIEGGHGEADQEIEALQKQLAEHNEQGAKLSVELSREREVNATLKTRLEETLHGLLAHEQDPANKALLDAELARLRG